MLVSRRANEGFDPNTTNLRSTLVISKRVQTQATAATSARNSSSPPNRTQMGKAELVGYAPRASGGIADGEADRHAITSYLIVSP